MYLSAKVLGQVPSTIIKTEQETASLFFLGKKKKKEKKKPKPICQCPPLFF